MEFLLAYYLEDGHSDEQAHTHSHMHTHVPTD